MKESKATDLTFQGLFFLSIRRSTPDTMAATDTMTVAAIVFKDDAPQAEAMETNEI